MKEYHIYYIEGVKIGCTTNIKARMSAQGNPKYVILETHTDIETASKREVELQIQYFGKRDTGSSYNQIANHKKRKSVIQYDKEGNVLGRYESIKEASKETNTSPSGIGNVCNGWVKTAGGFIWRFEKEEDVLYRIPYQVRK